MASDVIVSQELKSLQDELFASQKERLAAAPRSETPQAPAESVKETSDQRELRDQLHQLASELAGFFDQVETNISTHPTQSVVGALLVGILIGRLLGTR